MPQYPPDVTGYTGAIPDPMGPAEQVGPPPIQPPMGPPQAPPVHPWFGGTPRPGQPPILGGRPRGDPYLGQGRPPAAAPPQPSAGQDFGFGAPLPDMQESFPGPTAAAIAGTPGAATSPTAAAVGAQPFLQPGGGPYGKAYPPGTPGDPAGGPKGEQPFDAAHEAETRRREIRRRENLITAAEGFGDMGRMITAEDVRQGYRNPPRYQAQGMRRDLARYENQTTASERKMLGDLLGVEIPETIPRSFIEELMPNVAAGRRFEDAERRRMEQLFANERKDRLNDKSLREAKASVRAAAEIRKELELADNPVAIRSAIIAIARILNREVGTLTQADVNAYEKAVGMERWWLNVEQFLTSKYSPTTIERLKETVDTIMTERSAQIAADRDAYLKSFYEANRDLLERRGKTPEDVERAFGDIYPNVGGGPAPAAAGTVRITIPGEGSYDVTPEQLKQLQDDKVQFTTGG